MPGARARLYVTRRSTTGRGPTRQTEVTLERLPRGGGDDEAVVGPSTGMTLAISDPALAREFQIGVMHVVFSRDPIPIPGRPDGSGEPGEPTRPGTGATSAGR